MKLTGKVSHFGGPDDTGVAPDEGLAFIYELDQKPELFLPEQPPNTTGLARRLDPAKPYIATRWDYSVTSKDDLLNMRVLVHAPKTGKRRLCVPADWGPHEDTGRVADISPGLMAALGIETDDDIEVVYGPNWREELGGAVDKPTESISVVISSGHGLKIRGAAGPEPWGLDEVDEARKVVGRVAEMLNELGIDVTEFHDDISTTQDQNLNTIVNFHNSCVRDLDVSVHFNAYTPTEDGRGCEVYAISQMELAAQMSAEMAKRGDLTDRGAKSGSSLFFCNHTDEPSLLVETCFVDAMQDVDSYKANFEALCAAIASTIAENDCGTSAERQAGRRLHQNHPRYIRHAADRAGNHFLCDVKTEE